MKKKIDEAKNMKKFFNEHQILEWIMQTTDALKYLHSFEPTPIIHRDVKPG